jgi:hypothetical protein
MPPGLLVPRQSEPQLGPVLVLECAHQNTVAQVAFLRYTGPAIFAQGVPLSSAPGIRPNRGGTWR